MNDRYKGRQSSVDPTVHERLFRNQVSSTVEIDSGTLENKISMLKVKDARKAIRRRYASRTNAEKIFSQYDLDNKGFVTANDLHYQATKMGLGMSLDEAQVLI
jgi:Ca2+-binding EF-hand superfamily protein